LFRYRKAYSLRPFLLALLLAAFATATAQAGVFDDRKAQCTECHGDNGVSKTPNAPSLGGQPELFVLYQLVAFREGQRKVPAMNDMMKGMSDDDLRAAAAYVAKLPPPPPPTKTGDPARMARGEALVAKNRCGFCHNPDFSGHDQIPRLKHQREDYLLKALRDYKAETRIGGGAMMSEVLYPLKDNDLIDLAYYMAHVR
jgi:cytochrome c553